LAILATNFFPFLLIGQEIFRSALWANGVDRHVRKLLRVGKRDGEEDALAVRGANRFLLARSASDWLRNPVVGLRVDWKKLQFFMVICLLHFYKWGFRSTIKMNRQDAKDAKEKKRKREQKSCAANVR
jgi:hypothetical protein